MVRSFVGLQDDLHSTPRLRRLSSSSSRGSPSGSQGPLQVFPLFAVARSRILFASLAALAFCLPRSLAWADARSQVRLLRFKPTLSHSRARSLSHTRTVNPLPIRVVLVFMLLRLLV
jgi:hypothetical protein